MSGPGPKPEPKGAALVALLDATALASALEGKEDNIASCILTHENVRLAEAAAFDLAALRASLVAVTAERDALELTLRRMTGAGEKALAGLHAKSETNSQPEIPPVAEKEGNNG